MKKFRTEIKIESSAARIRHQDPILLLGSCFSDNIGVKLRNRRFNICQNPFGILYNPASIQNSLERIVDGKKYTKDELMFNNSLFYSLDHHGSFAHHDAAHCLNKLNANLKNAKNHLSDDMWIIVSLGTSWVFTLNETGNIVGNCHKLPASNFSRRRLSIDEIVNGQLAMIERINKTYKNVNWLYTVSPIRHLKDGLTGNQLSKATLLLAVEKMVKENENIFYFPSYEILVDDLRDYRFYAEDMIHPSGLAVDYIWELFSKNFIDDKDYMLLKRLVKLEKDFLHRPIHKGEAYRKFLEKLKFQYEVFGEEFKYLDFKERFTEIDEMIKGI